MEGSESRWNLASCGTPHPLTRPIHVTTLRAGQPLRMPSMPDTVCEHARCVWLPNTAIVVQWKCRGIQLQPGFMGYPNSYATTTEYQNSFPLAIWKASMYVIACRAASLTCSLHEAPSLFFAVQLS